MLFSSVAATWGSGRAGGYAAANAFLDALADSRRARGLAATSVAWGLWGGGGMAGRRRPRPSCSGGGCGSMDPGLAVAARWRRSWTAARRSVTVADVDWARFAPAFTVAPAQPADRRPARGPAGAGAAEAAARPGAAAAGHALAQRLAGPAAGRAGPAAAELVRAEAAAVLGHASPEAVEAGRGVPGPGVRLADRGGAAEPAGRGHRAAAARHAGVRLPDAAGGRRSSLRAQIAGMPAAAASADRGPRRWRASRSRSWGWAAGIPGGVPGPEDLWELLAGRHRRDRRASPPTGAGTSTGCTTPTGPGTSYARQAGSWHDAGEFDAGFFGISPREALAMDPQQRLLLEVCWEALERAGIDPAVAARQPDRGVRRGGYVRVRRGRWRRRSPRATC